MREVLQHRQARAYLLAQMLSVFGDTTLWLGTGIWVLYRIIRGWLALVSEKTLPR